MIARVRRFLGAQAPAIHSAFATTLACEIALVVVMALHLPNPAWALVTIFVLATPTAGASLQKAALRVVGTAVGASLSIGLIHWFDQAPIGFSLALFAICVVAAYGGSGPRYPYAYVVGLITVVIVAMEGLSAPERTVYTAFARAAEVSVGVATAVLVRLSIWPVRTSATLRGEMATTLELSVPLLRGGAAADPDAAVLGLLHSRQQQQALLQTLGDEGDLTTAQGRAYARAVAAVSALVRHVLAVEAILGAAGASILVEARDALAQALEAVAHGLRRERRRGGEAIAQRLAAMSIDAGGTDATGGPAAALAPVLRTLSAELGALARSIDRFGPGGFSPVGPADPAETVVVAKPRAGLDRGRLLHAAKVGLVVLVALWIWMTLHLPGGMQALVTVVVIAQRTAGATLLKGQLRLIGAVLGGTAGILVASLVIPGVSSLGVFGLLIAPAIFASAWLNDGSPRYGYVGFQSGFAFILTLVSGSSPDPDTMAPVYRVCGVLLGILVVAVVMQLVAPVDTWREVLAGIGRLLGLLGRSLAGGETAAGTAERSALRDQTVAYMAEIDPGRWRRGWPRWSLPRLVALQSRLGAVISSIDLGGVERGATAELRLAAGHLAAAADRLGNDVAARRSSRAGDEVAAAHAAVARALQSPAGAPIPAAVLAQAGGLQTAAALLGAIERVVATPDPIPLRADPVSALA